MVIFFLSFQIACHAEALAKAGRLSRAERICGRRQMNRGNFFSELKRRNVYKVGVVVPWLLIQARNENAIDSMTVCPTL